jgi:hypothetical protein
VADDAEEFEIPRFAWTNEDTPPWEPEERPPWAEEEGGKPAETPPPWREEEGAQD